MEQGRDMSRRMNEANRLLSEGFTPMDHYDELFNRHVVTERPATN